MSVPQPVACAPVLPDYTGANLARLVPCLRQPAGNREAWLPAPVRDAEQVVLLVVDGLGWLQLQARRDLAPALLGLEGAPITSVVPSTTAAALTSITVGAPPASHGVVGYKLVVDAPDGPEVMNVLRWRTAAGTDVRSFLAPEALQPIEPFGGKPVPVVSKAEFTGTGFSDAHQRGARVVGWVQTSSLAVDVWRLVAEGEPFVYAYYEGIDKIAHYHGFGDHYDAELVAVDRIVQDLLETLPPGVALVVTADHGQVEVGARAKVLDSRLMSEVSIVSGEARFRWLHVDRGDRGAVERVSRLAGELYGDEAWIATVDQVEAEGWLGGSMTPAVRARLGDVVVVPHQPVAYLAPAESAEPMLACRHGSLTPEEMFVPLLAAPGRGRGRLGA